jgi:hypothetical protein
LRPTRSDRFNQGAGAPRGYRRLYVATARQEVLKPFDVVFALNFGLPASLPANRVIAAAALRESRAQKIPLFYAPSGIFELGDCPDILCRDFSGYISTVKQVRALVEAARDHDWRRVLVIAAPPHHWRARRDLRVAGFDVELDKSICNHPRHSWYARESEHRQTTTWFRWWFTWELPARLVILLCPRCYERRASS